MIKKVILENIQAHSNSELIFESGLNVIYGNSDEGKSSIIRGLRWFFSNRFNFKILKKHNSDKSKVVVQSESFLAERRRSEKVNVYVFNNQQYKALGTNVPEDIKEAFNVDSNINIQHQGEIHFLIDDTPGNRAKILNEVSGLQIIDKVLKDTNSRIRATNDSIRTVNSKLNDIELRLMELDWVDAVDLEIQNLKRKSEELNKLKQKYITIEELVDEYHYYKNDLKKFLPENLTTLVNNSLQIYNDKEKLKQYYQAIHSTINTFNDIQKELNTIQIFDVSNIEKIYKNIKNLQKTLNEISDLVEEYTLTENDITEAEFLLEKTKKLFNKKLKEAGNCPLCGVTI